MIEVQNLTRTFGALRAVDGISFSLERGEVVGLLGLNGAGKSTTMRMLTGFLPPTSGVVRVGGHDVFRESLAVRRQIGYLAESVPLYAEHRVEEMLVFQGRLHGMARRAISARIGEVLDRVGLADRRRSLIGNLSKGQRQRVGIAVAMLPEPEVLILDEPTSGLDPLQRIGIRTLIKELAEERTVLFSSHILPEVEAICPRVIVMHRGKIAADGKQEELIQRLGKAAVHVEAAMPNASEAKDLLGTLPGVSSVEETGQDGIYHGFDVHADGDVREDVGALAMQRGWALRSLSREEPTLEKLFASIALDLGEAAEKSAADVAPAAPAAPAAAQATGLPLGVPGNAPSESKVLFNLNPFDAGGMRDLGKPKAVEAPPTELLSLDLPPAKESDE